MSELLKALLFGGAGYAIGNRISNDDAVEIVKSYLTAVNFESLIRDWQEQHICEDLSELISDYVEKNYIVISKKNEYF